MGLLAIVLMASLSGCGSSDGLAKRYKVSGKVTYKGQPLAKGNIMFYPATTDPKGVNNGATGTIVNGEYQLSTVTDNDGAYPGEYVVAIESKDVDMKQAEGGVKGGVFKQDDVAKAYRGAKSLIPAKYAVAETSGLKASVKSGSNSFNFELAD